jgi:outer membrane protein assembly factor BamB
MSSALVTASLTIVSGRDADWRLPPPSGALQAQADWPQWRGPNRDGAVGSFTAPASWPEQLTERWKVDVGLGYATPIVVGSRVFMFARQGENESMTAVDAATGKVVWRTGYPASFTMNSGAAQHGPGPKSTPIFSDGKVFAVGMTGMITAFDAASGKIVWQKPGTGVPPMFTTHAFSPLVDRGAVIFHVGGHNQGALMAFDVNTGEVKWRWDGDGPGYGSPIVANLEGTRQIITLTQRKLVGVDAGTGTLLWERPYATPSVTNAQTPNLLGNTVILGDAGNPVQAFRISRQNAQWSAEVAWETSEVSMRLSSAVLVRDILFGLSTRNSGQYFALDAKTGKTLWTSEPRQAAHAGIIHAGDLLFSLESDGELVIFSATASAFQPLRRYKVAGTAAWAPPVISGSRVFVKDVETLAVWTWDAAAEPRSGNAPTPAGGSSSTAVTADSLDRAIRWASVPAGRFQMGCVPGDSECLDSEKPRHWVDVAAFRMMTTDVTLDMYRAYADRGGRPVPSQPGWNSHDDQPVVNVAWADAMAFCQARGWRLPTEAEWEYAARGRIEGAVYAWGNAATPIVNGRKMANVADESARRENAGWTDFFAGYDDGYARTSPVGIFPPNAFGLFDMAGNVWRWTSTLDRPYPYRMDDGRENLQAPGRRVLRGGSWATVPRGFRVSYRVRDDPRDEDDYHGFRCVQ